MPTYQYRCKECGHDFDVVQAFSDDALTKCPECKKNALKKVYGNVGISFKGSGFYKNDARSSSSTKASTSSGDATSTGESSSGDAKSGADKADTKKAEKKKSENKKPGKSSTAAKSTD
jgi:putative FmdB family regulatory protein